MARIAYDNGRIWYEPSRCRAELEMGRVDWKPFDISVS